MVVRPAAVIFINADLTDNVRNMLVKQLHINDVVDGYVFDQRIASDTNYVNNIKQLDLRVMVVRSSMQELQNREYADVVCFFKNGLISILENKFGPPGQTYRVVNLDWGDLCIYY